MPRDEYKDWQDRYEDLEAEWDENWNEEEKRNHLENMKLHNDQYVCHSDLSSKALAHSLLVG